MARTARSEVFDPLEIAIAHVIQRCVRRCFLMGRDPDSGKNYDHRKQWLEARLQRFAAYFGIDLLCFSILSNHFHLVLRSRPDVVAAWDDTEVARRWLMICPVRKDQQGNPLEPTEAELNKIRYDPQRLATIRRRLSDISWWMRLLSQPLAAMANREEDQLGRFWQGRFRAVRICDAAALLACAAYVDLNPIRAALAETLEGSDYTSIQRRIESLPHTGTPAEPASDQFLAPIAIDESRDAIGAVASRLPHRASDKGFLPMSEIEYIRLLDWTARVVVPGKSGATPADAPDVLERLGLNVPQWAGLVRDFGRLFSLAAGLPATLAQQRTRRTQRRWYTRSGFRQLFESKAA
jgi:REP element-mobilizing transposase RayT